MEGKNKTSGVDSVPPVWLTILMLLVFSPVGIFLMWKYTNWNKVIKIVISAILGLWLLIWIIAIFSVDDVEDKKVEPKPEKQQEEVVTKSTSADLAASLAKILNDKLPEGNKIVKCDVKDKKVIIDCDMKDAINKENALPIDTQVAVCFEYITDPIASDLMKDENSDLWKLLTITFYNGDEKMASIKKNKSDVQIEENLKKSGSSDYYYFDYDDADFEWFIDKDKLDKITQSETSKKKESKKNDVKSDDNTESDKTPLEEAYDMGKQWLRSADWDAVFPYGCKMHDIIDYSCKESEPESSQYGKYCASVGMDLKNAYGAEFKSLMLVFMDENYIMTHVFYREADGSYIEIPLDNIPVKSY